MKYLLYFLLLTFPGYTFSQLADCGTIRYDENVFDALDSTKAVKFGENTFDDGETRDLLMDIYEPANDTALNRPLVMLAFGGSFTMGAREDLAELARRFARKGYVAATIDYRIFSTIATITDSSQAVDLILKTVSDYKAAIRFFRENASGDNTYGIDPNLIFIGGTSAGAIVAVHTAYLDSTDEVTEVYRNVVAGNGGWEGNSSENTNVSSEVAGVLNYTGALNDANWIDAEDPPLFSVHDEQDIIVPYGSRRVFASLAVTIHFDGSFVMTQKAQESDLATELITVPGSNSHVSYFLEQDIIGEDSVINASARFMKNIICGTSVYRAGHVTANFSVYPNPVTDHLFIDASHVPGRINVSLRDLMGREILNNSLEGGGIRRLTTSEVPHGWYVLEVKNEKNRPIVVKILVQR